MRFDSIVVKVYHFATIGIGLQMKNKKILLFSPSMWPILTMGTVVWRGKDYIQPMKREEKDTFVSSLEETTFYLFKLLSK